MGYGKRLLCPHMTQVLLYFNETGSQGERLHLLSLGPHTTGKLIGFNESVPDRVTMFTHPRSEAEI